MTPTRMVRLPYAAIAVVLTIWLARQLSRHGLVFLRSVFAGRDDLATAINQLLVIGFYLVNLGWAMLVDRLGILLLLLGLAHLMNLYVFHRIRRGASASAA